MMNRKIRVGVLSPSEIAARRFMPALPSEVDFVGIAVADRNEWLGNVGEKAFSLIRAAELKKATGIVSRYGGIVFESYLSLITSGLIDAIYIPLPPSLHFKWGEIALKNKIHVLMEKPLTTCFQDTKALIDIARKNDLLIYENYAFEYHKQIGRIKSILHDGTLGDIRFIRSSFGFPHRGANDFRYFKSLGGGALNDCGGYPIKLLTILMENGLKVKYSRLGHLDTCDVDVFGCSIFENDKGLVGLASFGMDNAYKCDLEIWGSKNVLYCPRVFTPPADFKCEILIKGEKNEIIEIDEDDYFKNSINNFLMHIDSNKEVIYNQILLQDGLMEQVRKNDE